MENANNNNTNNTDIVSTENTAGADNSNSETDLQTDFEATLNYVNSETFIYYDPPYRPINASSFNSYAVGDFDDDEQRRLKDVFAKGNKLGALEMLSNSDPTNYNPEDMFFDSFLNLSFLYVPIV